MPTLQQEHRDSFYSPAVARGGLRMLLCASLEPLPPLYTREKHTEERENAIWKNNNRIGCAERDGKIGKEREVFYTYITQVVRKREGIVSARGGMWCSILYAVASCGMPRMRVARICTVLCVRGVPCCCCCCCCLHTYIYLARAADAREDWRLPVFAILYAGVYIVFYMQISSDWFTRRSHWYQESFIHLAFLRPLSILFFFGCIVIE